MRACAVNPDWGGSQPATTAAAATPLLTGQQAACWPAGHAGTGATDECIPTGVIRLSVTCCCGLAALRLRVKLRPLWADVPMPWQLAWQLHAA